MRATVVTVSDRVSRGQRDDVSGPLGVELLRTAGFDVSDLVVVPDDSAAIRDALILAAASEVDLVLTTGGTGLGPRDVTPEATTAVLERLAPGLADLVRRAGQDTVPTAALSRGVAGLVGRTLVINVAGSPGAVRDAVSALAPLLPHAVAQLHGGDH